MDVEHANQKEHTTMYLVDHQELDPPRMLCPFRTTGGGEPAKCMGESCALWYADTNPDYSGCAPFVGAFYACNTSYNTRQIKNVYRHR